MESKTPDFYIAKSPMPRPHTYDLPYVRLTGSKRRWWDEHVLTRPPIGMMNGWRYSDAWNEGVRRLVRLPVAGAPWVGIGEATDTEVDDVLRGYCLKNPHVFQPPLPPGKSQ